MRAAATIPEALFATAERGAGEFVFHLEQGPVRLGTAELAERAWRGAQRLLALGVEPGDSVGVLGPNRPEWVVWAFAAWIAGAALVPVQIPLRIRDPDAFREQLRRLVEAGGCRRVLADPRLAALLPEAVAVPWDEDAGGRASGEPLAPAAGDAAVIQFTSGSTADPKGALLTHAAVLAQMDICGRCYRYEDETPLTALSWTPFFHDLGLFANLVHPVVSGATIQQLPTELFARDPAAWLRLIGETRAALTVGPSSAFGSAVKAAGRSGEKIDLSSLEVAFFAAEGVDPEVAMQMGEAAQDFGLDLRALGSSYGLAEAVLGVACPYIGSGMRIDRISLEGLAAEGLALPAPDGRSDRLLVSCGPPLMDLRIVADGEEVEERHVGEIQVRGPSVMTRYVGEYPPDPFVDGWLRTGDLGYLADGELYVTGRAKDMVIAVGHNYYPEDFEWAAGRVEGVRPGRCVAFNPPGAESVVLLVEARSGYDSAELRRAVANEVADTVGIAPGEVVVLPAGVVQKTTSGKLRRGAMREAYASGVLS